MKEDQDQDEVPDAEKEDEVAEGESGIPELTPPKNLEPPQVPGPPEPEVQEEAPPEVTQAAKDDAFRQAISEQTQNLNAVIKGLQGLAGNQDKLDNRLNNMEAMVVKLGEAVKGMATGGGGSIDQAVAAAGGGGGNAMQQFTSALGPLAGPVLGAITPKNPMDELFQAWVQAQIGNLNNPAPNMFENLGFKMMESVSNNFADNMFAGQTNEQQIYAREYAKEKARLDAKMTATAHTPALPPPPPK